MAVIFDSILNRLRKKDVAGSGTGDVVGPSSSTNTAVATFNGTDGKLLASSSVLIDSTGNVSQVNTLKLSTTPTVGSFSAGKLYYDSSLQTMSAEIDGNLTTQLNEATLVPVYNNSGVNLTKGTVVYPTGSSSNLITIGKAQANASNTSLIVGVLVQDINNDSFGRISLLGYVSGLNTTGTLVSETWNVGDNLFVSPSTAGYLTNVEPEAPNYKVRVARVVSVNATTGVLYVNPTNQNQLNSLTDVSIKSPVTDQLLRYNGSRWVNGNPAAASASAGVNFYPDDTVVIGTGAENANLVVTLAKVPNTGTEEIDTITVNNNTVLYGVYVSSGAVGGTSVDAGIWEFDFYAAVNNATNVTSLLLNTYRVRPESGTVTITGTGTSRTATASTGTPFSTSNITASATVDVGSYLQTPKGLYLITARTSDTEVTIATPTGYVNETTVAYSVYYRLFQATTGEINNTATTPLYAGLQLYAIQVAQPAFTIATTDKIALGVFGTTNATANRIIYFSHNGTTRYSHVISPLVTRHNDLAGLNGGSAGEMYHLTSAQHTIATQAATDSVAGYVSTSAQSFGGVKTFGSFPITPSSAPTTDYQVANKKYVDDNAGGGFSSQAKTTDYTIAATDANKLTYLSLGASADSVFSLGSSSTLTGKCYSLKNLSNYNLYVRVAGQTTVCSGGTAASSTGTAANAFDGSTGTSCDFTAQTGTLTYDFGSGVAKAVNRVRIYCDGNNGSIATFGIQYSSDNSTYVTVASVNKALTWGAAGWYNVYFQNDAVYRYWRVNILTTKGAANAKIFECEMFTEAIDAGRSQKLLLKEEAIELFADGTNFMII